MKIIPFVISLLFSGLVTTILTLPISMIAHWLSIKLYNERPGFWTGLWLGGINSFILVWLSIWVFGWFNYLVPISFIFLITIFLAINNYHRYNSRSNKHLELGYLLGYLIGIPAIYIQSINMFYDGIFNFL